MTAKNSNTNTDFEDFIESAHSLSEQAIKDIGELEAIFRAINSIAQEHSDIKKLASAGAHLAMDKANAVDCWRDQVFEDYRKESAA